MINYSRSKTVKSSESLNLYCKSTYCKCRKVKSNGWTTVHCPECGKTDAGISPTGAVNCFRCGVQTKGRSAIKWSDFVRVVQDIVAVMTDQQVIIHNKLTTRFNEECRTDLGLKYYGEFGLSGILSKTGLICSKLSTYDAWGKRIAPSKKVWHREEKEDRVVEDFDDVSHKIWTRLDERLNEIDMPGRSDRLECTCPPEILNPTCSVHGLPKEIREGYIGSSKESYVPVPVSPESPHPSPLDRHLIHATPTKPENDPIYTPDTNRPDKEYELPIYTPDTSELDEMEPESLLDDDGLDLTGLEESYDEQDDWMPEIDLYDLLPTKTK